MDQNFEPKAWRIGPLYLAKPPSTKLTWIQWVGLTLAAKEPDVAFGSQAEASEEQLHEIAIGLEQSEVSFLWGLRSKQLIFLDEFKKRVKVKGIVVKG